MLAVLSGEFAVFSGVISLIIQKIFRLCNHSTKVKRSSSLHI